MRGSIGLPLTPGAHLRVSLVEGAREPRPFCVLARLSDGRLAWEWSPESLEAGDDGGANLASRQVPFISGVHVVGRAELDGLPGLLFDSLPDAWGRLLTDRALRRAGVTTRLHGLDRLAIVGHRGPGAFSFEPEVRLSESDSQVLDLDRIASEAALALSDAKREPEFLTELERLGGSAGGSRPKVWIAVDESGYIRAGAAPLGEGETGWLVKFRAPKADPKDIGRLEFAYALMAREAGLEVPEPWLIETSAGAYFASRRYDREGRDRVHVVSAAGLLNVPPAEAMGADYADLLRLTRIVTRSESEVLAAFSHAAFNVLAHNRDDHLRQFAFCRRGGSWHRAPAFDLTFSEGPGGEHTLLVAGEGRHPTRAHLERLGKEAGLRASSVRPALERVEGAVSRWEVFAKEARVSATTRRRVKAVLSGV